MLRTQKCVYGDFTITEFKDDVLTDNIVSLSLSDSDHLIFDRKVCDSIIHRTLLVTFSLWDFCLEYDSFDTTTYADLAAYFC